MQIIIHKVGLRNICVLMATAYFVAGCAARPEPKPDPQRVAEYRKDLEDQLGITRANETRERCARLPKPAIGMTASQLTASCWGPPRHVAESVTAKGKVAGWSYPEGKILLVDSIVTRIDTSR